METGYFEVDPVVYTFDIRQSEMDKINAWAKEIDDRVAAEQMKEGVMFAAPGSPYYGACGGGLTFSFTPTSIGTVVKVKHSRGGELDVTDYDSW